MEIETNSSPLQKLVLDRKPLSYSNEEIRNVRLRRDIAVLYAQVFADEPWNERTRCVSCGTFSTEQGMCSACGNRLVPAYPMKDMMEYFRSELGKNNSVLAYAAEENDLPVAFAWGFPLSVEQFVDMKYKTEYMRNVLRSLLIPVVGDSFFYFSECGVRPDQRKKGLASMLTNQMLNSAQSYGLPMIMRTNDRSPMVKIAQRVGMDKLPYDDVENLQRVIFTRT
ncbi:MAG: hypothetical protein AAB649_04775 [Patescibacteria group bacterium]